MTTMDGSEINSYIREREVVPVNAVPTFEDLAIDDTLSDVERIEKYVCSNIALQRLVHVKMLTETAISIGYSQTCTEIIPLLDDVVCDTEFVVRQHVASQLPELSKFLVTSGGEQGYHVVLNKVLPVINQLICDQSMGVRCIAGDSLTSIAKLVKDDDKGQHILTIILPLAHEDDNDELRITAVKLLNQMAEVFGPDLCHQFVTPELISLSEDPVFRVRKATALNFSHACRVAGEKATEERLLPAFIKLSRDDVWGVRKACAESLGLISECVSREIQKSVLVSLFNELSIDESKWVSSTMRQNAGRLIATMNSEDISKDLIESYTDIVHKAHEIPSEQNNMKYECAYTFPAVVLKLGKERWPELSTTFGSLYDQSYYQIRETLSCSLPEIARIVGQDIADAELLPAFEKFLNDTFEVKMAMTRNMSKFLDNISPKCREEFLPMLNHLFMEEEEDCGWRYREIFSDQLAELCTLFTLESTNNHIVPLFMRLLKDEVAFVRDKTCLSFPSLMVRLSEDPLKAEDFAKQLISLNGSSNYKDRQIFVRLCHEIVKEGNNGRELFQKYLQESYMSLMNDPVKNVSQMIADFISDFPTPFLDCDDPLKKNVAKNTTTTDGPSTPKTQPNASNTDTASASFNTSGVGVATSSVNVEIVETDEY